MMLGAKEPVVEFGSRIRASGESSLMSDAGNDRTTHEAEDAESADLRVWVDQLICEPMSEPEKDEGCQWATRFAINDQGWWARQTHDINLDAVMNELTSLPDMGYNATREPAAFVDVARAINWTDCSEMVIPKSEPNQFRGLQLWRKARFAVYACNRMRLVLESMERIKPEDKQTANQTATQVNSLSSLPPFDEALQVQLRNCSSFTSATTEERHSQYIGTPSMPAFAPTYYRTHSGKLGVVLESLEPVENGCEYQIASQLIALVNSATQSITLVGGSEFPHMPWAVFPENGDGIDRTEVLMREELMCEPVPVPKEDESVEFVLRNVDPNRQEHHRIPDSEQQIQLRKYRSGDRIGDTAQVVKEHGGDDGMRSDSLRSLPEKIMPDSPPERLLDLDRLPIFPVQEHSNARSACAPPLAGKRPIGTECAGSVLLTNLLMGKFEEAKASYHSELQKLILKTYETFESFKREVNQSKENLIQRFREIDRTVTNFSRSEANIQKRLPKAISRIIDICNGDLGQLVLKTDGVLGSLGKIQEQHELSVTQFFQNCASFIHQSVDSNLFK